MADIEYNCTKCGRSTPKEALAAKAITFRQLGVGKPLIRSRTVEWLCERCMVNDPVYNLRREDGPDARQRRRASATARRT